MRYALKVSYDGTEFAGWQRQKNAPSVQECLETAIKESLGIETKVTGSGRTDAGVHAKGQVAHFETPFTNIPADRFYRALNIQLPPDVRVIKSEQVDDSFNACNGAKRKTYCYNLYVAEVENPLLEPFNLKLEKMPDLTKIQNAIPLLIGEHDFKCMCASGSSVKSTVRTIYDIKIKTNQNQIAFYVTGNGFLYNMVRILVSTLLDIGYKKITNSDLEQMLITGKRSRSKTLLAKGLCLESVEY